MRINQLKVYYNKEFVGVLEQDAHLNYTFAYDEDYLVKNKNPFAKNLPLRSQPFISNRRLHSFFDYLISKGIFFSYIK